MRSLRPTLATLLVASIFATPGEAATRWPGGAKAAVVLTYDDALPSQLDHAVPALDGAGLKGTFFLANVRAQDVARWRAVARGGHELGNHTIFHPCRAAAFAADPRYTTEAYTPTSMLKEITQQNVLLTALDGKTRHGFATPCGETKVGGVDYLEPLHMAGLASYVRGVRATPAELSADVSMIDPMHVPARGFGEGDDAARMIAFVKEAEAGGGMAVLLFHGVGDDHLAVTDAQHRAFIAWLKAHRRELWVTTLQQVLDWAKGQAKAGK